MAGRDPAAARVRRDDHLISHDGTCCIGMSTDTLAITDLGGLADDLQAGLDEVMALKG